MTLYRGELARYEVRALQGQSGYLIQAIADQYSLIVAGMNGKAVQMGFCDQVGCGGRVGEFSPTMWVPSEGAGEPIHNSGSGLAGSTMKTTLLRSRST